MSKGFKVFLLILALLFGWGIWNVFLDEIVPRERTFFMGYQSFYNKVSHYPYPEKLPSSADDIKYFHYTGWFEKQTGISFTAGRKEYQELKETYQSSFMEREETYQKEFQQAQEDHRINHRDWELKDWSWYGFDKEVTPAFLEEEELEYLNKVFHNEADTYTLLAYEKVRYAGGKESFDGILCNDDTNEMVIFYFHDKNREEQ